MRTVCKRCKCTGEVALSPLHLIFPRWVGRKDWAGQSAGRTDVHKMQSAMHLFKCILCNNTVFLFQNTSKQFTTQQVTIMGIIQQTGFLSKQREAGTTKQDLIQTLIKLLTPCLCLCCCRNKTTKGAQHLSALSGLKMLTQQVQTYLSTTVVISVTRSFMPRVTSEDTSTSTVGKSPSVVTSVERLLLRKAT